MKTGNCKLEDVKTCKWKSFNPAGSDGFCSAELWKRTKTPPEDTYVETPRSRHFAMTDKRNLHRRLNGIPSPSPFSFSFLKHLEYPPRSIHLSKATWLLSLGVLSSNLDSKYEETGKNILVVINFSIF